MRPPRITSESLLQGGCPSSVIFEYHFCYWKPLLGTQQEIYEVLLMKPITKIKRNAQTASSTVLPGLLTYYLVTVIKISQFNTVNCPKMLGSGNFDQNIW